MSKTVSIKRDKPVDDYTAIDLVKYFARCYRLTRDTKYAAVYARDCTLMGRILYKFQKAKKTNRDILRFIDDMFKQYHDRIRTEDIDVRFLLAVVDLYLYNRKLPAKIEAKAELTNDLKEWLKAEKKKWKL